MVLLLVVVACYMALSSATLLEMQIHYPASQIQALPTNAVFTLALCYETDCLSADRMWNQTWPGPYDPRLTISNDDYKGNDLFVKQIDLPDVGDGDADVYVAIYAAYVRLFRSAIQRCLFYPADSCWRAPLTCTSHCCIRNFTFV